jgi:hypothetical protein
VSARTAARGLLVALALSAAVPRVWATLAPHGFYAGFPGTAHWVDRLPPYNAHLVTDVGAFYVGFAVLFGWAAVTLRPALVLPACVAWSVFSAIHLAFHATHLSGFATGDAAGEIVSLAVVLVLPGAVALMIRHRV